MKLKDVPLWPELGLVHMHPKFEGDADFNSYMPPIKEVEKDLCRHFFWAIVFTIRDDFGDALIEDARLQRLKADRDQEKPHVSTVIGSKWARLLLRDPFISCKCDRQS